MEQKVIEHPLRKISFAYDEHLTWTPEDDDLLHVYLQLHDQVWEQHEEADALVKKYLALDRDIEKTREELTGLKKTFAEARDLADHILAAISLKQPQAMEHFAAAVNTTSDMIQAFHAPMQELFSRLEALQELKNKYHEMDEDNELWDKLLHLTVANYSEGKQNAIDLVSFDEEENRFRDHASFLRHTEEGWMQLCNDTIENYNKLLLESQIQFEVWEEFGKRLLLIEQITLNNEGLARVEMN